jgi:peptidoglycan hydrolase CwlO-like protein
MAELEVVLKSQIDKIGELEAAHVDLKRERDNMHTGYQRLLEKHKALNEKVEHQKVKLVEAHTVELAKLHGDLDLETCSCTEYRQTVRRRLHELHETVALSFDEA